MINLLYFFLFASISLIIYNKENKENEKSLEYIFCELYYLDENSKRTTSFVFIHENGKETIEKTCEEIIEENGEVK
jgi:hypothetical protein